MRTLAVCACALALTVWACSNGDENGNGNGTPPVCGNNRCEVGETCANCSQDCGCPRWRNTCFNGECIACGDDTCNGDETCTSCVQDCGCGADQVCRENACRPISTNPLIESMPGRWMNVTRGPDYISTVSDYTESLGPNCGCHDQPAGDACFQGFDPPNSVVLSGTRIIFSGCGRTVDGEVTNDGTRVVYDWSDTDGNGGHEEWEKQ